MLHNALMTASTSLTALSTIGLLIQNKPSAIWFLLIVAIQVFYTVLSWKERN